MNAAAPRIDSLRAYADAHARVAQTLPGGAGWQAQRAQALERFLAAGWPGSDAEGWKYTPLHTLEKRVFSGATADLQPIAAEALERVGLQIPEARRLVFLNGRFMPVLSDAPANDGGVQFTSLADRFERSPDELLKRIPPPGDSAEDRLTLLNFAFLGDGADLRVAAGVISQPVYLLFLYTGSAHACHPRVVLEVGSEAVAQVIEHHVALDQSESFSNGVTDLRLADGARLEHFLIAEPAARAIAIHSVHATQETRSRLTHHRVLTTGLLSRASLQARLEGSEAEIEVNALLLGSSREHLDLHSVIEHIGARTRSTERFRGAAGGRSRGVFNGRIVVRPSARGSESQQSSRALLLAATAEIDSRPQLEIYTDEVKCSHGATTGQLDANMLFYLLSRGLDPTTARALLIFAFLDDVVARFGLAGLRRHLEQRIVRALPDADRLQEFM